MKADLVLEDWPCSQNLPAFDLQSQPQSIFLLGAQSSISEISEISEKGNGGLILSVGATKTETSRLVRPH